MHLHELHCLLPLGEAPDWAVWKVVVCGRVDALMPDGNHSQSLYRLTMARRKIIRSRHTGRCSVAAKQRQCIKCGLPKT